MNPTISPASVQLQSMEDGRPTSSTLTEESLGRLGRANEALGAFVHVDDAGARDAARAADARIAAGGRRSPIDGVPISVKDNLWVRNMPASWGSRMWADFVPPCDDIAVERVRAAGAVILGKTNTPEFAFSPRTDSPLHGPARNPWNTKLTPGGSSGGAAASVAAGITSFAIATDAGGSTRLPASYTGLYGLRPSNGRIPRRYGFLPIVLDFQAIGLLTRSLEDLETLYRVVAGPDPRDSASERAELGPVATEVDPSARTPKIGWFAGIGEEAVDPEVRAAVGECAAILSQAGCEVFACEAPYDPLAIRRIWGTLGAAGVARAAEIHPESWRTQASRPIAEAVGRGLSMSAADYVRALDELAEQRSLIAERWGDFDAFLCPSAASPAWSLEEPFPPMVDGRPGHPGVQNTFATFVNAIGHPGLSVPARPHADGRPLGVQLVGRFGGEAMLFELARRLRDRAPWAAPDFPDW